MTIKEKLNYFANHGMSVSYIAKIMNVNPATLSKWLRDEKGITHKNEQLVLETLKQISNNFRDIMKE